MRRNKTSGFTLIELMIVVAIIGILAAVAIPAFIKYIRKSKTVEATEALDKIKGGARQYYVTDHWDSNGNLLPKAFPTATIIPSGGPKCDKQLTPTATWDTAGWAPLHFALTEPHYYAYTFSAPSSTGTSPSSTPSGRWAPGRSPAHSPGAVPILSKWFGSCTEDSSSPTWAPCPLREGGGPWPR